SLSYKIFGAKSSLYLNPILASLSLFGLFLLVRLWIGDIWALIASLLFSFNSFANEHALFGDSHTSVVFFLIFGLLFLTIWLKKKSLWSIFFAGFCFGIIPTLRYAESLLLIAFVSFLLTNFQKSKTYYASFVSAIIGVGLPTMALAIRNQITFGDFWKTGYGLTNEPAHFGFTYFLQHFIPYIAQLLFEGLGVIFITGLIGGAILIIKKEFRVIGFFFLLLILPLTFLYMAYVWPPDPQSMRFLLPTFPIYTILTAWMLKFLTEKNLKIGIVSTILIVILTILTGLPRSSHSLQHLKIKNSVLVKIANVVEENIKPENILIANEGILQNLDFLGKWKLANISLLIPVPNIMNLLITDHDMPLKRIRNVQAREKYSNLSKDNMFDAVIEVLWKWSNKSRRIYLLGKEEQISCLHRKLSESDSLISISRIDIPDLSKLEFPGLKNRQKQKPKFEGNWRKNFHKIMMPNQIYDFFVDGNPLFLVEWKSTR
ncbi:MAG: glycosyltransferase family 39 protein, partial [bacterium]